MSAGTSASFCLVVCLLVWSSEAQKNVTAEPGQRVILPCKVHNNTNKSIIAVQWIRPELDPKYVLLYRDGHLDPNDRHPSYRNRTDLLDRQMKDGNVSLVLKDVKMEDTGRYECHVVQEELNSLKNELINTTNLIVLQLGRKDEMTGDGGDKDGGNKDGGNKDGEKKVEGDKVGIIVGSVAVVLILLAVISSVGFLINKRLMRQKSNLPVPPDDPADVQML